MTQYLSVRQAASVLLEADNILVLTHRNPDGDAIGSALAITAGLRQLGKRCRATWSGQLTSAYSILTSQHMDDDIEPDFILAVDIAGAHLLPPATAEYADRVDLAIDHHGSNTGYAKMTLVDSLSSSCCEIILSVLDELGVALTPHMGNCIYTGLATDTGCFRYSNTTPQTHFVAARLAETGVDIARINELFFEQKPRARVLLEREVLAGMEFVSDGRICIITITRDMMNRAGCLDGDIEDLAGIPRAIEGVEAGITLRQQPGGSYKISLRTRTLDASEICRSFGGGGHRNAAGCEFFEQPETIKQKVVARIEQEFVS